MKQVIYIVEAHRWGDRELHHYIVGAFTKKAQAIKCADAEAQYRGGKYACIVEETIMDIYKADEENKLGKEIYRAKSIKD